MTNAQLHVVDLEREHFPTKCSVVGGCKGLEQFCSGGKLGTIVSFGWEHLCLLSCGTVLDATPDHMLCIWSSPAWQEPFYGQVLLGNNH
jgi:hypothetical protein